MRRRSRRPIDSSGDIDITPMIDVVFIMLIFFVVSTSFVKEAGIDVNRPSAATAVRQERGNVVIAIRPSGEVWMDGRPVDIRAVRSHVERLRAGNPAGTVILLADEEARSGTLVRVMDSVRQAGVDNVAIAAAAEAR